MKRKYFFLIIMLLSVIYFTSGKPTEISDRVTVHAIGIDFRDSEYKVTMQIFAPEAAGSDTAIDPSKPNVSTVNGRGITVSDAVRGCYSKLGGNIFLGQNQIIIFGKNVDISNKSEVLEFFLSSSESFLNVCCAAAENTAEEILEVPLIGNTVSSEKFPMMIESAAENGRCIKTTFMDLLCAAESQDKSLILPVFSLTSSAENSAASTEKTAAESLPEASLKAENGAVYVGGKFAAEITYEQMGIAGAVIGSGKYIRTRTESGSKTYRVKSREVSAEISDGSIIFNISLRVSPKDVQTSASGSKREMQKENENAISLIEKKSQSFADSVCENFTPELLGAEDYMKRFFPELYAKYRDNPDALYSAVKFNISVKE